MDARITKERLGNALSYDWIKMIAFAVGAVLLLMVLFTTARTMPTEAQTFTVYAFTGVSEGADAINLSDDLTKSKTFSYEILSVEAETFSSENYGLEAFTARRSAGQGDVLFVTDNEKLAEDGSVAEQSELKTFVASYAGVTLDTEQYFLDCEAYLNGFFGDWRTGTLDEEKAEACFRNRNTGDKRYKNEESMLAGIEQEKERLNSLRDDLLAVEGYFENGLFTHTRLSAEDGSESAVAIRVGKLSGLSKLYYYAGEKDGQTVKSAETLSLMIFNNGTRNGDMEYETVSFLRYLAETYETSQG